MSLEAHFTNRGAGPPSLPAGDLSADGRIDARILRGLSALAGVPPRVTALLPSGTAVFDSALAAATTMSALGGLPGARTRALVDGQARYLIDALQPPGQWSFCPLPGRRSALDLDTTFCALAALAPHGAPFERLVERLSQGVRAAAARASAAPPGAPEALGGGAAVNLLYAEALRGREWPALALRVASDLREAGLDAPRAGFHYASPFVGAYLLGRWLRIARAAADVYASLADEVARLLLERLHTAPPSSALEAAAALSSLFDLGVPSTEAHPLARRVLDEQDEAGLWPAAPLWADAGVAWVSVQATSALCLEALYKYARAGAAVFRPPRRRAGAGPAELCGPRPCTLDRMLDAVAPCLPDALVSTEALAELKAITAAFPYTLANGFGLECRLGDEAARADLALLAQCGQGREILAGVHPLVEAPRALAEHAVWRRVRGFCGEWASPESLAHRHVEGLWLEFDVDGPPPAVPVPSVFVALRDDRGGLPREDLDRRHLRLAGDALETLWSRPVPPEVMRNLRECCGRRPAGSDLFAVGAMLSRDWDVVRLGFKNVAPEDVPRYLDEVGWPGPRGILERWLRALAPAADRIFVNLDVGAELLPTLGLELTLRRPPAEEPRWDAMLRALEAAGLCREAKRRALLSWPGPFQAEQRVGGDTWISCFDHILSHVKLGFGMGGRLEAKAYIGAWQAYSGKVYA